MNMGDNITREDQVEICIESLEAANFNNPNDIDKVCEEQVEKSEPKGECRYCHEEELVSRLEAPCGCDGSLKVFQFYLKHTSFLFACFNSFTISSKRFVYYFNSVFDITL
jgi:hypothetical protein